MTTHRIYIGTGQYNLKQTERIVKKYAGLYFDGYTIYKVKGYWKGEEEDSLVIEVISDMKDIQVLNFANKIKKVLLQETVLVTEHEVKVNFVWGKAHDRVPL